MIRIGIFFLFGGSGFVEFVREVFGKEFIVFCFEIMKVFRKCRIWILKNNSRGLYVNCYF